jgi:hypothetical protein
MAIDTSQWILHGQRLHPADNVNNCNRAFVNLSNENSVRKVRTVKTVQTNAV